MGPVDGETWIQSSDFLGEAQAMGGGELRLARLEAQQDHVLHPGQFGDAEKEGLHGLIQGGRRMHDARDLLDERTQHQLLRQEILILVVFRFQRVQGHFDVFPLFSPANHSGMREPSDYTTPDPFATKPG